MVIILCLCISPGTAIKIFQSSKLLRPFPVSSRITILATVFKRGLINSSFSLSVLEESMISACRHNHTVLICRYYTSIFNQVSKIQIHACTQLIKMVLLYLMLEYRRQARQIVASIRYTFPCIPKL